MNTPDDILARGGGWTGAATGRHRVMSLATFAAIVSVLACIHLGFWALRKPDTTAASVEGKLPSISYNRFAEPTPDGLRIPEAQIRADLTVIAAHAKAVRTYASTQGLERVPEIAAELGLTVTLGVWLDKDKARNEREIATALDLARRYRNVTPPGCRQ
jgi:exo-beta-1,3-glucanase (GH17 family)